MTGPNVLLATDKIAAGPAGTLGPHAWPGPVLTIPAGLPASCDYYLVMEVDPGGTLEETDETNNAFAVPVTVSPDGASNCDPERFN